MEGTTIEAHALAAKAQFIAECLYKSCVLPDNGKRVKETGSISPASSLKHHAARKAFTWASKVAYNSRFFTHAACRLGVEKLLDNYNLEVPVLKQSPRALWVEQQSRIIMHLCARSRRNCGSAQFRSRSYRQLGVMDWEQTLALEARFPGWFLSSKQKLLIMFSELIFTANKNILVDNL